MNLAKSKVTVRMVSREVAHHSDELSSTLHTAYLQLARRCEGKKSKWKLKQKVKLPLCLIKQLSTRPWRLMGSGGLAPPYLTSALEDEWSGRDFGRLTPGTHYIGGWVAPRAGIDVMEKHLLPLPGIETRPPTRSPSLYRLSYRGSSNWKEQKYCGM
jgi:hypothetical protein